MRLAPSGIMATEFSRETVCMCSASKEFGYCAVHEAKRRRAKRGHELSHGFAKGLIILDDCDQ